MRKTDQTKVEVYEPTAQAESAGSGSDTCTRCGLSLETELVAHVCPTPPADLTEVVVVP